MSTKRNPTASVRDRLLQLSKTQGLSFDLVLTRYGIERLLYRLSISPHASRFVLKGAMLFTVWTRQTFRPTRDVDFLGFGPRDIEEIGRIFQELCAIPMEADGLSFQSETVEVRPIREDQRYGGLRVELIALLGQARIRIQADIGFGDAVTPGPEAIEFPTLLADLPAPHLNAYPIYTVVAEKLEAMASLGQANSRMKDFYDIWFLASTFPFDGAALAEAIRQTFGRRQTPLDFPSAVLSSVFAAAHATAWNAFISRNHLAPPPFGEVLDAIRRFVEPPFQRVVSGEDFSQWWPSHTVGWQSPPTGEAAR